MSYCFNYLTNYQPIVHQMSDKLTHLHYRTTPLTHVNRFITIDITHIYQKIIYLISQKLYLKFSV